jgi:membrane fusion protein (multidrug efflux system)
MEYLTLLNYLHSISIQYVNRLSPLQKLSAFFLKKHLTLLNYKLPLNSHHKNTSNMLYSRNTVKQIINVMKTPLFILAIFLVGCSNDKIQLSAPVAQSLPVMELHNSAETTFTEYPASIQGAVDLEIRSQVSGTLDKIYVNEGALVQKGQPLFKINELPYREALNNAKAVLHSAQAAVTNANLEVDKLTPLVANKVVSDFQLKSAKAALQVADANVEQAKAGVAAANINLGYTLIKAPVAGYIGRLPKKQGSIVDTNDQLPLTQLSDTHEVHVYFSLGEDDFIAFNANYPGKTVAERLKNLPGVSLVLTDQTVYGSKGKIDMVDGQFDKQTGAIALRATFQNAQGTLRSGNTGKVRLSIQHADAVLVPQSSTVEIQDKTFVFTLDKANKASKTPITITGTIGTNYVVKDGLKSGDRIVFDGIDKLKEGDTVQPEKTTQTLKTASINK